EAEERREGKLSIPEIIRCRVRYFCDGAVFGSVEFVNGVFEANRWRYGSARKTGARNLRGGVDWGDLRTLRDLQVRPLG
ncbi:MAG: chemotaxis protein CheW, partial [Verrucomicrobiales bacterium]|nr:chemotaxis protein CheW [Verrucomicrobiales bacterium]